jgi:hypothetical protein
VFLCVSLCVCVSLSLFGSLCVCVCLCLVRQHGAGLRRTTRFFLRESSFAIDGLALGTLGFFFFFLEILQRAARCQQAPLVLCPAGQRRRPTFTVARGRR